MEFRARLDTTLQKDSEIKIAARFDWNPVHFKFQEPEKCSNLTGITKNLTIFNMAPSKFNKYNEICTTTKIDKKKISTGPRALGSGLMCRCKF